MDTFLNDRIKVDEIRQQVPAFFYKRLNLFQKYKEYFLITIDYGYAFLLRSIRTKWQPINDANGSSVYRNVKIEFMQTYAGRALQNEPIFARLISTPAESGNVVVSAAPAPVDDTGLNVNMTATPVKNNLILNTLYQRRSTLDARLQFDLKVSGDVNDMIVDILFVGYYIPDRVSGEWE